MLNARDRLDRTLLKFGWELRELNKRLHHTVPLAKPIHTGWTRRHVLSPKADHREDKETLRQILEVIGTVQYSKRRDFREKRKKYKGQLVQVDQPPRNISPAEWLKKQLPVAWRVYFRLETIYRRGKWREEYVFIHRGLFELKIRARFITETYAVDPLVARRIHEIESWLKNHNAMHRLNRLRDISTWKDPLSKHHLLNRLSLKELLRARCNPSEVDADHFLEVNRVSLLIAGAIFFPA